LALAEAAAGADLFNGRRDIDARVFFQRGRGSDDQLRYGSLEFFVFEGLVATSAE
jgi:hypothetical protein